MDDSFITSCDVCIVGAGVAGSAMAAVLAKSGKRIALIERKWEEPDEIIGELLQPSGVQKLNDMGFEEVFENIDAQPINGYVVYLGQEPHRLSYPINENNVNYQGYGFRYGRFVQQLRNLTKESNTVDHIQGTARSLITDDKGEVVGVELQPSGEKPQKIRATLTIVSQGSMSSLRGEHNKAKSHTKGFMIGVVLEGCELPFPNHGHVIMADPAPILAYPVGNGKIRVLIDFPKDLPVMKGEELKDYLKKVIQPQLPHLLKDKFLDALKQSSFKGKPTHLLASRPIVKPGVVLMGDALNMRHPTTGAGMTVALTDVKDLGEKLNAIKNFSREEITPLVAKFYQDRHAENATVNILAYALYCVFRHKLLRQACFTYLQKGGKFSAEPMALLSGISRNRGTLMRHFFAVGWLAVLQQLKPFPNPARLGKSLGLVRDTLSIILPLMRDEVPRVKSV